MIGNQDKALSAEKDLVEIAIDYVWREQSAKEIADSRGVSSKTILRRLRDLFRCAICGSAQGMLQAHHVDLDRTNNDEANLLTLCAACHLAYHGRGELELELEEAHLRLLQRLTAEPGVGTGDDQWA